MSIKIQGFGGPVTWILRKKCSAFTSKISLTVAGKIYNKKIKEYIEWFLKSAETPPFKFIMFETVNRCNGTCSFCPASKHTEKRPYKKMQDETFLKVLEELKAADWRGTVFLQVNNEPFVDPRLIRFAQLTKEKLPSCRLFIITNGTLLNEKLLLDLSQYTDELVINDYSEKYRLSDPIKKIYRYVKKNKKAFEKMDICIKRRYSGEILATRAGNAPNKPQKNNKINFPCIYPFTDLIVFPDGKVGMCCNDCYEVTDFGNVNEEDIFQIWGSEKFTTLRESVKSSREGYPFCRECDVVDAGSREKVIKV